MKYFFLLLLVLPFVSAEEETYFIYVQGAYTTLFCTEGLPGNPTGGKIQYSEIH